MGIPTLPTVTCPFGQWPWGLSPASISGHPVSCGGLAGLGAPLQPAWTPGSGASLSLFPAAVGCRALFQHPVPCHELSLITAILLCPTLALLSFPFGSAGSSHFGPARNGHPDSAVLHKTPYLHIQGKGWSEGSDDVSGRGAASLNTLKWPPSVPAGSERRQAGELLTWFSSSDSACGRRRHPQQAGPVPRGGAGGDLCRVSWAFQRLSPWCFAFQELQRWRSRGGDLGAVAPGLCSVPAPTLLRASCPCGLLSAFCASFLPYFSGVAKGNKCSRVGLGATALLPGTRWTRCRKCGLTGRLRREQRSF